MVRAGEVVVERTRWELPCLPHEPGDIDCDNDPDQFTAETALVGVPGTTYEVSLRFRGVVELKTYDGAESVDGVLDGHVP